MSRRATGGRHLDRSPLEARRLGLRATAVALSIVPWRLRRSGEQRQRMAVKVRAATNQHSNNSTASFSSIPTAPPSWLTCFPSLSRRVFTHVGGGRAQGAHSCTAATRHARGGGSARPEARSDAARLVAATRGARAVGGRVGVADGAAFQSSAAAGERKDGWGRTAARARRPERPSRS